MTIAGTSAPASSAAETRSSVWTSRLFWVAVLVLYLVAHIALRLWETPNVAKNDVQEAISAQGWAWGYHPRNPPLHTWLLMSSYSVFGVGLMAHAVLRYVLLGTVYVFAFLSGRRLLSSDAMAAGAALAFTLLAPFAWTVHTALTHTLLLAAVNLATLWAALRLTEKRRTFDYALFGAVIAIGFLAKYSFILFLAPLLIAMLCVGDLRRALGDWRMLLTLGVALALFAPHGIWMLEARFDFVQFLADKQQSERTQPYLVDVASGLGNVAVAALTFLVPLILIAPILFRAAFKAKASAAPPWARATALMLAFGLGLLVLDVFVMKATQFEMRYMMCALLVAPLVLFQWLDRRGQHNTRGLVIVVGLIAVGVFAALAGRAVLSQQSCNRCWEEMPIAEVVQHLRADGFTAGTIISDHYNVAGNMRLAFPHARVFAANYDVPQPVLAGPGQCLMIWNARNSGDALPDNLRAYLTATGRPLPDQPSYIEAPIRRSGRMDRFAYWVAPNADANCRPR